MLSPLLIQHKCHAWHTQLVAQQDARSICGSNYFCDVCSSQQIIGCCSRKMALLGRRVSAALPVVQ